MRTTIALLFAALLAACGPGEAPVTESSEGREETRSIRNTEAIGYAGDAIADKVDSALDANDQRREQLDAELDEATR
jgi:hypothetical protein